MTTDLEKSFKAKLRSIAKEQKRDPSDLWQNITIERFLVRLAESKYSSHFILKGGILLSKYIDLGRETMDLDFLAKKISNEAKKLESIFGEIASIDLKDGFSFRQVQASQLSHPHMAYVGVKISMMAFFGKTRFKLTIDIGFGDVVTPINLAIPLTSSSKGFLFEKDVNLPCYPKEFIFAEKLETVVYRGSFNSRMKDFHDLYSMVSLSSFPTNNLGIIVHEVFKHRKTKLQLPINFNQDESTQLQKFWREYLNGLTSQRAHSLPEEFSDVIQRINSWLKSNTVLY